jgi:hypothetical protein
MRPVLHVDHCHQTGHVRALLCTGCNSGLGAFRDSPERLREAAAYIEHHVNLAQHRAPVRSHNRRPTPAGSCGRFRRA